MYFEMTTGAGFWPGRGSVLKNVLGRVAYVVPESVFCLHMNLMHSLHLESRKYFFCIKLYAIIISSSTVLLLSHILVKYNVIYFVLYLYCRESTE